jgi:hypothetical protein
MIRPDPRGPTASNGGDESFNASDIVARQRLGQGLRLLYLIKLPVRVPQTSSMSIARYLDTVVQKQQKPPYSSFSILFVVLVLLMVRSETALAA